MLRIRGRRGLTAGAALLGFVVVWTHGVRTAHAGDPRNAAIEQIVGVLHEQGLIDETQRESILIKHYSEQAKAASGPAVSQGMLEGFEWSGDLRLRYEGFRYDDDNRGIDRDNRDRFRYRVRLGFTRKVNDWAKVGLRLASGADDPRSTNRTIGDDEDFDPDEILIDRAYAEMVLPALQVGDLSTRLKAGKIANPFVWKRGKDFVVWDGDINPEGAALLAKLDLGEGSQLFFNTGAFIVDENSTTKDPKFFAGQLGGETTLGDGMTAGLRVSGYEWRSLDNSYIGRATGGGNLQSAFDSRARIGDVSGYFGFSASEDWPVLLYGTAVRNFTADSAFLSGVSVDEEDTAWGAGVEVGSSSKWFKFGAGFFEVEANSVIGQFTDSNLFDGFTNRRGWLFYGSKRIAKGTELKVEFFNSDSLENTAGATGPFATSIADADRQRFRTDLQFTF